MAKSPLTKAQTRLLHHTIPQGSLNFPRDLAHMMREPETTWMPGFGLGWQVFDRNGPLAHVYWAGNGQGFDQALVVKSAAGTVYRLMRPLIGGELPAPASAQTRAETPQPTLQPPHWG